MFRFFCRLGSNCVQNAKRILNVLPIRFLFFLPCSPILFCCDSCNCFLVAPETTTIYMMYVCPLRFCVLLNAWQNVICTIQSYIPPILFAIVYSHGVHITRENSKGHWYTKHIRTDERFCTRARANTQHSKIQHWRPTITENIIITLCTHKF